MWHQIQFTKNALLAEQRMVHINYTLFMLITRLFFWAFWSHRAISTEKKSLREINSQAGSENFFGLFQWAPLQMGVLVFYYCTILLRPTFRRYLRIHLLIYQHLELVFSQLGNFLTARVNLLKFVAIFHDHVFRSELLAIMNICDSRRI